MALDVSSTLGVSCPGGGGSRCGHFLNAGGSGGHIVHAGCRCCPGGGGHVVSASCWLSRDGGGECCYCRLVVVKAWWWWWLRRGGG